MKRKHWNFIDWLFVVSALICLILILCPFSVWKSIGDSLASDGNMERLTPQFVSILRIVLSVFFIVFTGLILWKCFAGESRRRFFQSVGRLPGRCCHDFKSFFRDFVSAFQCEKKEIFLLLMIIAAGTIVRALQLKLPLLHDEAYSMAVWGRSDLLFAISDYHLPNNHIFHSVLINLIYHHIGKSVVLLRMPVFLSGCLLILAVWLLGKQLYNNFIALTAAGMTAFAPYLIFYSVNARGYEIQTLLSILTFGLAVYAKRKKNIFSWFLLIVLSGLNFFTLPIALYPFGGICVWLFLNVLFGKLPVSVWRSRGQLFKYLIFMGISVSVLTLLLYIPLLHYSGWNSLFGNVFVKGVEPSIFGETMLSRLVDNVKAFTETLPVFVSLIIAFGLVLSVFSFRKTSKEKISYGLSLLLWMGLLIPIQKPNLWPRTLLFLHPFLLLFAASGLSVLRFIPRVGKYAGWFCAVVVLAAGISQFLAARNVIGLIGPDEKAIRMVLEREGSNAGNILFVTEAQDNAPIWIYADEYGLPAKIFDKRLPFNTIYAFVNPMNDTDFGPKTLDDLLARCGPGENFMIMESEKILMEEESGILYRFDGRESTIRKAYGEFPEVE